MTTPIVLPDSDNLKRCNRCHEWKPFEAFSRHTGTYDGLQRRCKACDAEYYRANKEKIKAYRQEHADEIRAYQREYYHANFEKYQAREKLRPPRIRVRPSRPGAKPRKRVPPDERAEHKKAIRREYYLANKERLQEYHREYMAEYRAEHKEEERQKRRDWIESNPEEYRARKALNRHKRRTAGGSFTAADIEAIRVAQGNRCYLCHKKLKKYHIDHFIPISKGGTNDPGNLRLACPKCNYSKHDKHPFELGVLL